ncbi:hypothetical protein TRIUR3_32964 [Triticum urartu]|uniref:Uncharacterized protein n=1 Tax=Triticum urartu TaxID=4572 RepID=M7ZEW2_TRIUA|nr:hypothetical protein TRIUR3_32964 [Triticum urartu]
MERKMRSSGIERLIKRRTEHHVKNSEKRVLARKALMARVRSQELGKNLRDILIKKISVRFVQGSVRASLNGQHFSNIRRYYSRGIKTLNLSQMASCKVDNEWPYALKNSLTKLWDLYKEAKAGRIRDNLANEEKISKLEAEIKMVQEKYNQHIQLTKDFCESVQKSVHKENYRKIMMDVDEEKIPLDAADKMINLEKENFDLKKKVEVAEKEG